MDYKIIALDIDGTLTNSQKEITPHTRYAIIDAQKMGKKVVIASGRHPMGIQSIARDLLLDRYEGYIMAFNGGKILDCTTGQTIVSKDFPKEYLSDILGVLKESNLSVHTYDDKKIITGGTLNDYSNVERDILKMEMVVVEDFAANIPEKINKLLLSGEPAEIDKYNEILAKRYDGLLDVYKSAPYFLEIMPFGVTKGSMLPMLLEKLGFTNEEMIAFGDNYNDITMIGYAGLGVAMGNAEEDVKKIANYVCESNDDDGVAKTLEKYVLKSNI
ncbi:Cof-type HAD-IIB family hydrolase [uncultured Ruminococcus sp.]|mgnify:FL=1|jgi:Cof subfamily protein (haloacid dehalogenase superfamily)|uniref:Cof-type HAD-IIB family hydrolase n=1 Tax=Ruminococcus sp. TaxID=41978 RepID=UPI00266F0975|nr:Cof-type HAD-IIB family hydrolase [uncultured Ruminococcus sp.]